MVTLLCLATHAFSAGASVTSRTAFDQGWKFARFGKMPDGSLRVEPGALTGMITASTSEGHNPPGNAIDGKRQTRWCASGEADNQWLQLDMGRTVRMGGVRIVWEKETGIPFAVEVSADGARWKTVIQRAPSQGTEQTLPFSTAARYVRLMMDGSPGSWASVRILEVRDNVGRPIEPRPANASAAAATPEQPQFNDSRWRKLDLPHDWAIEGPFRMEIENETGKLPWEGIGWYRKTVTIPSSAEGRRFYIDFDGAMSQATVYINGKPAGEWAYGYNAFRIDATPHLQYGHPNTIAVRLENMPASTRWYPGAGIYRHVWLVESPPVHIAHWGTYVTTPGVNIVSDDRSGSAGASPSMGGVDRLEGEAPAEPQPPAPKADSAEINVAVDVTNTTGKPQAVSVVTEILDPEGKTVARTQGTVSVPAESDATCHLPPATCHH